MAQTEKSWFRLRWRTLFLLVLLSVTGWSLYSYWAEYTELAARKARETMSPPVGSTCTVLLRRDELGIKSNRLTPMTTDSVPNNVRGKFMKLNDEWIVLESSENKQVWIPREHVLLLRVE